MPCQRAADGVLRVACPFPRHPFPRQDRPGYNRVELAFSIGALAQNGALIGIDSNYVLDMAKHHRTWKDQSGPVDPYVLFAKLGCRKRPCPFVGR